MGYDCSVTTKGCNYCQRNKTISERAEPLTQYSIERDNLVIIDPFGIHAIKVNYCPLCGKKLVKELY